MVKWLTNISNKINAHFKEDINRHDHLFRSKVNTTKLRHQRPLHVLKIMD